MSTLSACTISPLVEASLADGFCAGIIPVRIQQPRTLRSLGASDFLALERGTESVVVAEDLDGDGIPESLRPLISNFIGLNHGLEITSTHLYASNSSHVYRWSFDPVGVAITGNPQLVIENINADGMGGAPQGHRTRTLAIDGNEVTLYVSVGSNANIDRDSYRSRIRRFLINDESAFPFDFLNGEVFADGIRNEVALEFAPDGVLWGAMNAADELYHPTLGGEIHDDNPAEEVHRFAMVGQNYGYPYCWREYNLPLGLGRGTAWAWPNASLLSTVFTDDECRSNFNTPALAMQAHSAPLGMTFYQYSSNRSALCSGVIPFSESMNGYAFVAFHGSWNRETPTGYKVVYFPITADGTSVMGGNTANTTDLFAHNGTSAMWTNGLRPVDVKFDGCGRLLVSSDGSRDENEVYYGDYVVRIESTQQLPASSAPTTSNPSLTTTPKTSEPSLSPSSLTIDPTMRFNSTARPTSFLPSIYLSMNPSHSVIPSLFPSMPPEMNFTTKSPGTSMKTPTIPIPVAIMPSNTVVSGVVRNSDWLVRLLVAAIYLFFSE